MGDVRNTVCGVLTMTVWGWVVKGIKWLGIAFRVLKAGQDAIEEKPEDKDKSDKDGGCDNGS